MKIHDPTGSNGGFTIIELLISMVVNMILLTAVFIFFMTQNQVVAGQEQSMRLQQNEKNALNMIVNDVVMAGFNPKRYAFTPIIGSEASMTFSQYTAPSFTGYRTTNLSFDPTKNQILKTVNGTVRPVAGNIKAAAFTYLKADGTPLPLPVTAVTGKDVRQISISITSVTTKNKAGFSNLSTMRLTETITPPNLGLE